MIFIMYLNLLSIPLYCIFTILVLDSCAIGMSLGEPSIVATVANSYMCSAGSSCRYCVVCMCAGQCW